MLKYSVNPKVIKWNNYGNFFFGFKDLKDLNKVFVTQLGNNKRFVCLKVIHNNIVVFVAPA